MNLNSEIDEKFLDRKWSEMDFALNRYGKWTERDLGLFSVEKVSSVYAMDMYLRTLKGIIPRFNLERTSGLFIKGETPVHVTWTSKDHPIIGKTLSVTATGEVREEFRELTDTYIKMGYPYLSSGSAYCNIPNKSYSRVKELMSHPEYQFPVLVYDFPDQWRKFWLKAIVTRFLASKRMLEMKKAVKNIFSQGNEKAGTGVVIRGLRRSRELLDEISPEELLPLLWHQAGSAFIFAVLNTIRVPPGNVWMITYHDPGIRGAIASRSDSDIEGASYDRGILTTNMITNTRQVGTDCSGVLSNAKTEKREFGRSVSEEIWREAITTAGATEQRPPFFGLDSLVELWTTETMGKDRIVIGEDFGMLEPLKLGADTIFSGIFVNIHGRVLPHLLSGTWYTTLTYVPFHLYYGSKIRKLGGIMVCLGDDLNTIVDSRFKDETIKVFYPYVKVKGTKENNSKLLGFWTCRLSPTDWIVAQTPRVLRTESSASQVSSEWADQLQIGESGSKDLYTPQAVEQAIKEALPINKQLVYFRGTPQEIRLKMKDAWKGMAHEEFLPNWTKYISPGENVQMTEEV